MAITSIGDMGSAGTGNTAGTSIGVTVGPNTVGIGGVLIVVVSKENTSTADGDNSEVTSVTDDAGGNTYTKLGEYTNSAGVANDGATVSVWMTRAATAITNAVTTVTANFASCNDRNISCWGFNVGNSLTQSAAAVTSEVNTAADFGSSAFSSLASKERLFVRGLAKKLPNVTTDITVSSGFTTFGAQRSRNNASEAVLSRGEWDIDTGTGSTSNPTLAGNGISAGLFFALEEAEIVIPSDDIGGIFVVRRRGMY